MKIMNINSPKRFQDPSIRILRLTETYVFIIFKDYYTSSEVRFDVNLEEKIRISKFPENYSHITNHVTKYLRELLLDLEIMNNTELDNWIRSKEVIEKFKL